MYTLLALAVLTLVALPQSEAGSKKGFGLCGAKFKCGDTWAISDGSWWYNWHTDFNKDLPSAFYKCPRRERGEYIPMIARLNEFHENLYIRPESKHVLVFNEPNVFVNGGFRIEPEKAASLWPIVEKIAKHRIIVGPAVMRCEQFPHSCWSWYDRFFKACKNCRVDKIAIHSYHCNVNQLMATLDTFHKKYNKPVWLTEFACENAHDDQGQINFMKQIVPKLEKLWYLEKYAWFCARIAGDKPNRKFNLLNQESASLNRVGKVYNSL